MDPENSWISGHNETGRERKAYFPDRVGLQFNADRGSLS